MVLARAGAGGLRFTDPTLISVIAAILWPGFRPVRKCSARLKNMLARGKQQTPGFRGSRIGPTVFKA